MSTTELVVNRRVSFGEVYVGRPGPHGNPVELGKPCPRCGIRHKRDAKAIECTLALLLDRLQDPVYRAQVIALAGKVLACWCAPAWCHAELLVAYSSAYATQYQACMTDKNKEPCAGVTAHQSGVLAVRQAAAQAIDLATRGQQSLF